MGKSVATCLPRLGYCNHYWCEVGHNRNNILSTDIMEVCMKCSRKCFLRKNCSESPPISSFFKVMFGNKFSERLFLPPKFVRTHKLDVGRKMILKDSSGRRWCVVLSCIDGGLAFDKGWHEFSITHGIEEGDFVVFHYVVESSQFTVQIFGRSACEKQVFSVDNNKKRKTSIDEGYTFSKNKESYPFAKEYASVPDSFPNTEMAPSSSMAEKLVVKSLKSEILAPSGCSLPPVLIFKRRDESEDDVRMPSPVEERDPIQENIARGLTREPVRDFMDETSFMVDRNMNFSKEVVARMSTSVEERDPSHENIARGLARETVKDFMDDVSFMLDRNMNFCKEDVNEDLFDLSMFELSEKKTVTKVVVEMEGPSADAKKCHIDEEYIFSNNIGLMTENKESYPLAKEHASVPENSPDTEIAPSPSMAQKPVVKSLKSEILAPSGSWDQKPFPSFPEHGKTILGLEDPVLSPLKENGNCGRTRTPTPKPTPTPTPCPMPTTQSFRKGML